MKTYIKFVAILILAIWLFMTVTQAEVQSAENTVKFAQISDVHIHDKAANRSGRMLEHSISLLEDAVSRINEEKNVDFVIFTGDMIDIPSTSLLTKFINIANNLKPEWYWVTGNHDVGGIVKPVGVLNMLNASNPVSAKNTSTKSYYSFKVKNFVFLCLDGVITNKLTANGSFSPEQLKWLDSQLKANKNSYVVIFQHYPVVEPFHSESHYVLNDKQYLQVIDKYKNVVAVMSGHYHATKIKMRNNVAHISSPALVQYPNAFRIITLKTEGDTVELSYEFFPTRLTDVRTKSASQTGSLKLNEGTENDRNGTITLHKPLQIRQSGSIRVSANN